MKIKDK